MKIFQMNDQDWVAAETAGEATEFYQRHKEQTGDDWHNDDGEPVEMTPEQVREYLFVDPDDGDKEQTFADQLAEMLLSGADFPCLFASTEY